MVQSLFDGLSLALDGFSLEERRATLGMPTLEMSYHPMRIGDEEKMRLMCAGLVVAGEKYREAVIKYLDEPTILNRHAYLKAQEDHDVMLTKARG